ncbi:unnamed protein product, partial [Mesorhabditis spiculigera]
MSRLTVWASRNLPLLYALLILYLAIVVYLPGRVRYKHNVMPYWYRIHGIISLVLLVLLTPDFLISMVARGWSRTVCDRASYYSAPLSGWAVNLFFVSKLLDFGETVLIVFDDRRPLPIHIFHHFCTFHFFWTSIAGEVALLRPLILSNLGAHVLLFAYLTPLKFCGIHPCYLSVAFSQLVQFVVGFLACTQAYWVIYSGAECHVSRSWLAVTTAGIIAFLFLFADFYHQKYLKFRQERAGLQEQKEREKVELREVQELRSFERVNVSRSRSPLTLSSCGSLTLYRSASRHDS